MADHFLSERAARDIEEIADYGFKNFGVAKSREYGQGLEDCFNNLAESPLMGLGADELADGLRRFMYGSHWNFLRTTNRWHSRCSCPAEKHGFCEALVTVKYLISKICRANIFTNYTATTPKE